MGIVASQRLSESQRLMGKAVVDPKCRELLWQVQKNEWEPQRSWEGSFSSHKGDSWA